MDRSKLKGGLETRRGGKVYDQYDNMVKDCGCKMGEKCKCQPYGEPVQKEVKTGS